MAKFSLKGRKTKTRYQAPEEDEWYGAEDDDLEDEDEDKSGKVGATIILAILAGVLAYVPECAGFVPLMVIIGLGIIWNS